MAAMTTKRARKTHTNNTNKNEASGSTDETATTSVRESERSSDASGSPSSSDKQAANENTQMAPNNRPPAAAPSNPFLQAFWTLASNDPVTRQAAAETITGAIVSSGGKECAYAVKRLVRGLCSSRESARQGFATALTDIIARFTAQVDLADVLQLVRKNTAVTGATRGQEERDLFFGRIFGCAALARCGRLAEEPDVATAAATDLIELYTKRKWMREVCVRTLMEVIDSVDGAAAGGEWVFAARIAPLVAPLLQGVVGEFNPEQLQLAVALQTRIGERLSRFASDADTLKAQLATCDCAVLSGEEEVQIVRVEGGKIAGLADPLMLSSGVYPRVHSVWEELLRCCDDCDSEDGSLRLRALWGSVVEARLLTSTHERKSLAFSLLARLVARCQVDDIPFLLTASTLRCLVNNAGKESTYLHEQAQRTLKAIADASSETETETAGAAGSRRLTTLMTILSAGDVNFDLRTGTKVVDTLLQGLSAGDITDYLSFLEDAILGRDQGAASSLARRLWAVDAIGAAARNTRLPERPRRFSRVLKFLAGIAFFPCPEIESIQDGDDEMEVDGDEATGGASLLRERASARFSSLMSDAFKDASLVPVRDELMDTAAAAAAEESDEQEGGGKKKKKSKKSKKKKAAPAVVDLSELVSTANGRDAPWTWAFVANLVWEKRQPRQGEDSALLEAHRSLMVTVRGINTRLLAIHQGHGGAGASPATTTRKRSRSGSDLSQRHEPELPAELSAERRLLAAFRCLLLHIGLQMLSDGSGEESDDAGDTITAFQDTCECCDDLLAQINRSNVEVDEAKKASSVLVDVLLSLLSRPSALTREVAKRVFRALFMQPFMADGAVHGDALRSLLNVVCGDDAEGMSTGGDDDDMESEEGDEDGSSSDEEEDSGAANGRSATNGGGCAHDHDHDHHHHHHGSDSEEEIVISSAGDVSRLLHGSDDDGDGSDSDNSEMGLQHTEEADAALAAMLALKRQNRKAKREERAKDETNFKLRCIDLLDIYFARQSSLGGNDGNGAGSSAASVECIRAMAPILSTIRRLAGKTQSYARTLGERLTSLVKSRVCKCRTDAGADGAREVAVQVLTDLFAEAKKAPSAHFVGLVSGCMAGSLRIALAPASQSAEDEAMRDAAVALFQEALREFATKRQKVDQSGIFTTAINRCPSLGCFLLADLAGLVDTAGDEQAAAAAPGSALTARSPYTTAECFKLMHAALVQVLHESKRGGGGAAGGDGVTGEAMAATSRAAPAMASAFVSALATATSATDGNNNSAKSSASSKRIKPILQFGQTLVAFLATSSSDKGSQKARAALQSKLSTQAAPLLTQLVASTSAGAVRNVGAAILRQLAEHGDRNDAVGTKRPRKASIDASAAAVGGGEGGAAAAGGTKKKKAKKAKKAKK